MKYLEMAEPCSGALQVITLSIMYLPHPASTDNANEFGIGIF